MVTDTPNYLLGTPYHRTIEQQEFLPGISRTDMSQARFYKICDDAGAPKYLWDTLLCALKEEMSAGFLSDTSACLITKRDSFFSRVHRTLATPRPEAVKVQLSNGAIATVQRFHFKPALQKHLISRVFWDTNNIDMPNSNVPWATSYPPEHTPTHTSLVDSTWYHNTARSREDLLSTGQYALHPLILYIDKTGTDGVQKTSMEPLVCTSANLKQECRQDSKNWIVLGFVPNLEISSGAARRNNPEIAADYHRCLTVLLEPLKQLQREMPVMSFRRGNMQCEYRIICPVTTVMGDNLSQDKLCGKSANKAASAVRMSRCCLTNYENCDKVPHVCYRIPSDMCRRLSMAALGCYYGYTGQKTSSPISPNLDKWQAFLKEEGNRHPNLGREDWKPIRETREKVAKAILWDCFGSHALDNAFEGVDFGHDSCIHTATMSDIMHSLEEGIFKYIIQILLEPLSDTEKKRVDGLVSDMFLCKGANRSSERSQYPRVNFTRGFSSLSNTTANERVGQLFVISILLRTASGRLALKNRFEPKFDSDRALRASRGKRKAPDDSEEPAGRSQKKKDNPAPVAVPPNGGGHYSSRQLWRIMEKLDLKFVEDQYKQLLPSTHQRLLENSILTNIRKSNRLDNVLQQQGPLFPSGLLDYMPASTSNVRSGSWPDVARPFVRSTTRRYSRLPQIERKKQGCTIKLTMDQFASWIESLLAFHAFLKYGGHHFSDASNIEKYQHAYQKLIGTMVLGFSRGDGTRDWKLQKVLECSHFGKDHVIHGPPVSHNTDTGERGLKIWAKAPAATAQKRGDDVFKGQVANNTIEAQTLEALVTAGSPHTESPPTPLTYGSSGISGAGKSLVYEQVPGGHACVLPLDSSKGTTAHKSFPTEVLNWFIKEFKGSRGPQLRIQLLTEITLASGTDHQELLRAHPDFRREGPWYDYVSIPYEGHPDYPARCACFFEWPQGIEATSSLAASIGGPCEAGDLMVLVQESFFKSTEEKKKDKNSILYSHYTLQSLPPTTGSHHRSAKITCLSAKSINGRVFVVDPKPSRNGSVFNKESSGGLGGFSIIRIKDRKSHWPTAFLSTAD
jgi:hypothetical protein